MFLCDSPAHFLILAFAKFVLMLQLDIFPLDLLCCEKKWQHFPIGTDRSRKVPRAVTLLRSSKGEARFPFFPSALCFSLLPCFGQCWWHITAQRSYTLGCPMGTAAGTRPAHCLLAQRQKWEGEGVREGLFIVVSLTRPQHFYFSDPPWEKEELKPRQKPNKSELSALGLWCFATAHSSDRYFLLPVAEFTFPSFQRPFWSSLLTSHHTQLSWDLFPKHHFMELAPWRRSGCTHKTLSESLNILRMSVDQQTFLELMFFISFLREGCLLESKLCKFQLRKFCLLLLLDWNRILRLGPRHQGTRSHFSQQGLQMHSIFLADFTFSYFCCQPVLGGLTTFWVSKCCLSDAIVSKCGLCTLGLSSQEPRSFLLALVPKLGQLGVTGRWPQESSQVLAREHMKMFIGIQLCIGSMEMRIYSKKTLLFLLWSAPPFQRSCSIYYIIKARSWQSFQVITGDKSKQIK